MRAIACCAAGLTLLLSACAGAPEQAATAPTPAVTGDIPAIASAAAAASSTPSGDAAVVAEGAADAAVSTEALPQVDVNQLAAVTPSYRCRDMLRRGSNVIVQRCMTEEDWKRYERQEAAEAAEWVRMVQRNQHR